MALNGRLPAEALGTVPGTTARCLVELVPQLVAFRAAFRRRFSKDLRITDGYRPYWLQVEIMLDRYKPITEFRRLYPTWSDEIIRARKSHVWNGVRRYLLPGRAQAAFPGTSNHGEATAFDFGSGVNIGGSDEWRWAVANAPYFGLRWPSEWAKAAREFWHFEDGTFVPVSSYRRVPGAVDITLPGGSLPDPLNPEDDMTHDEVVTAVKVALAERDVEIVTRDTQYGRNAGDNLHNAIVVTLHRVATRLLARGTPTDRQAMDLLNQLLVDEPIDAAALATALAPALLAAGAVGDVSDEDLAAIATVVNDEADRRARARLDQ